MPRLHGALSEQLGNEAAGELEEYTERLGGRWREQVMQAAAERFDGRLTAVAADLRSDMASVAAGLRVEMAGLRLEMREEMAKGLHEVRQEMHTGFAGVWKEMADLRVSLRKELADSRVEALRWSFLFWIGQVAVMASLLAFMLRGVVSR
jgi:hypothetical protein